MLRNFLLYCPLVIAAPISFCSWIFFWLPALLVSGAVRTISRWVLSICHYSPRLTTMASAQVYHIPDSEPNLPLSLSMEASLRSIDQAHIFQANGSWVVASIEKPVVARVREVSSLKSYGYNFLHAAVAARKASHDVESAYRKIAQNSDALEELEDRWKDRDAVLKEFLQDVRREWSGFAESFLEVRQRLLKARYADAVQHLTQLRDSLLSIRDQVEIEAGELAIPEQVFNIWQLQASMGGMETLLHSFENAMTSEKHSDWCRVLRLLMDMEKQNSTALAKLGDDIASIGDSEEGFTVAPLRTERLTVHRSLLHLGLLLLETDPSKVSRLRGREVDIASWQTSDWARRWKESFSFSDKVYDDLRCVLQDFSPCDFEDFTVGTLKTQHNALRSVLQLLAGEIGIEFGPSRHDGFDAGANVMIVCASVGIFGITPELVEEIPHSGYDYQHHAAELSRSPLYSGQVSSDQAKEELDRILQLLKPQRDLPIKSVEAYTTLDNNASGNLLAVGRVSKRPSPDHEGDPTREKRQK